MTKKDKTRAAIASHSGNLRFEEVHTYLLSIGATHRSKGSHCTYTLPDGMPINFPKPHGGRTTLKPFYVKNDAALTSFEERTGA